MPEDDDILNDSVDEELDAPITSTEVSYAIKKLKTDKSPGVDGVPAEFFKVILTICSIFSLIVQYLYDNGFVSEQWFYSLISPGIKLDLKIIVEWVCNQI